MSKRRRLERFERQRRELDQKGAALAEAKSELERRQKWWRKEFGPLAVALIAALAAILAAAISSLVTYQLGRSTLEAAFKQKQMEMERLKEQKEKELSLLEIQKKREWQLAVAHFIRDNQQVIFNGAPQERLFTVKLISLLIPPDDSGSLFETLGETADSPAARKTWHQARDGIRKWQYETKRERGPEPSPKKSDEPIPAAAVKKLFEPPPAGSENAEPSTQP